MEQMQLVGVPDADLEDRIIKAIQDHRPNTHKGKILRFFHAHRYRWFNITSVDEVFKDAISPWFITARSATLERRMRELRNDGVLESELDPTKPDRTHRWRMP